MKSNSFIVHSCICFFIAYYSLGQACHVQNPFCFKEILEQLYILSFTYTHVEALKKMKVDLNPRDFFLFYSIGS